MSELEKIMPRGYAPDVGGNPILTSCDNCLYCIDDSDGYEYGPSYYICTKKGREHVSNLKYFPFQTPQKCFKLNWIFEVDWDEVAKESEEG